LAPYWAPARRHVEDGYRSLPFPFDEVESPEFEMRVEWALRDMLAYVRTWSALRAMEAPRRETLLNDLRRRLAPSWAAAADVNPGDDPDAGGTRRTVTWPLSVRAGYV
ncbi:MAG: hypothetical protein ACODAB_03150, partial [Gemmatimonadota bacterium]